MSRMAWLIGGVRAAGVALMAIVLFEKAIRHELPSRYLHAERTKSAPR